MSYATTHIHQYSVEFYKMLEAETGLNAGFSVVGNLRMAQSQDEIFTFKIVRNIERVSRVTTFRLQKVERIKSSDLCTQDLKREGK
jgi:hypothetical protein